MNIRLDGMRAIVCGSTQGIGKAAAIELASLGASITLIARNESKLRAVLEELPNTHGQQHHYLVGDFSQPDTLRHSLHTYTRQLDKAHILVNNTGGPPGGLAIDAEPEAFMQAFTSHLVCNQIFTQVFVPFMKQANYGRIVNVISTSVKQPIPGLGVSNTIRAAVANWAKTLSVELGPFGITVNNVLPGSTSTGRLQAIMEARAQKAGIAVAEMEAQEKEKIPARRFADPAEVAAAIAFLCTPSASYINGINLPVDGGKTGSL